MLELCFSTLLKVELKLTITKIMKCLTFKVNFVKAGKSYQKLPKLSWFNFDLTLKSSTRPFSAAWHQKSNLKSWFVKTPSWTPYFEVVMLILCENVRFWDRFKIQRSQDGPQNRPSGAKLSKSHMTNSWPGGVFSRHLWAPPLRILDRCWLSFGSPLYQFRILFYLNSLSVGLVF